MLLFMAIVLIPTLLHFWLRDNVNQKIGFTEDSYDRCIYYTLGSRYALEKIPSSQIFGGYPYIALCFFAIPHIIFSSIHYKYYGFEYYNLVFSAMMMVFLFGTIVSLYGLKNKHKCFAYLMLLPSALYFSYNRYDILPAFLSILSIKFLSQERYKLAAFVLALSVWAKWYSILLLPIFMNFYYSRNGKINLGMLYIFFVTSIVIIMPTFVFGGIPAFIYPYTFHLLTKESNSESLFYLIKPLLGFKLSMWYVLFLILQFSIVPLSLFAKIDSLEKVINWSALSILVFMLFAKYYSPQWLLWVLPLLILRAQNMKDILAIIIFDLVTYLYLPVIFYHYETLLYPIIIVKTIILLYFIAALSKQTVAIMND